MLLWLAALLPLASGKPSCTREEGCSQVDLQGSLFLQRETLSRISQMATEDRMRRIRDPCNHARISCQRTLSCRRKSTKHSGSPKRTELALLTPVS